MKEMGPQGVDEVLAGRDVPDGLEQLAQPLLQEVLGLLLAAHRRIESEDVLERDDRQLAQASRGSCARRLHALSESGGFIAREAVRCALVHKDSLQVKRDLVPLFPPNNVGLHACKHVEHRGGAHTSGICCKDGVSLLDQPFGARSPDHLRFHLIVETVPAHASLWRTETFAAADLHFRHCPGAESAVSLRHWRQLPNSVSF
eukprot:CAMPEP_0177597830 /NCGR_PEP_ID=MMETSP0419_2-20121207/11950_1 /TAXON_ID=582737 /ORGANISM="Tetraselmis sp., Strain GSL018" /LENGTH=201 /DNA_ID=CAMNT_0019090085 /DNA_START=940 /DNA_END=1546 /DNA_ORIENTATION=-